MIGRPAFRSVADAAHPKAEQAISRQVISRRAADGARSVSDR
jgi:hypothetical protein